MAICSASRNPNRVGLDDSYQLTLIYDIDYSSSSTFSCKKRHILENERSKGLTAVRGLPQTRESTRWVTAGMDKSLCSWSFNGDFDADEKGYTPITYSSVHEEHTARVLALYFDTNRNILYSGGYDGRIVGWSMEHNHLMDSIDKTKRVVRDILPVSQHILLISHMDREREFDVIDTRVGSVVVNFGSKKVLTSADEKLERKRACHQRANIHPDGHLVSFGDFNSSGVNIWDLRKPHQAPILLQVHDQLISKTTSNVVTKTLVAPFYQDPNTSKNYLFSVGSDKKLFKIDLDRIYL